MTVTSSTYSKQKLKAKSNKKKLFYSYCFALLCFCVCMYDARHTRHILMQMCMYVSCCARVCVYIYTMVVFIEYHFLVNFWINNCELIGLCWSQNEEETSKNLNPMHMKNLYACVYLFGLVSTIPSNTYLV